MVEIWLGPFKHLVAIRCAADTFLGIPKSSLETLDRHKFTGGSGSWSAAVDITSEADNNYWFDPARSEIPILSYRGIKSRYFPAYFRPDWDAYPFNRDEVWSSITTSLDFNIYALGKRIATTTYKVVCAGIRAQNVPGFPYRLIALTSNEQQLFIYYKDLADLSFATPIETGDWDGQLPDNSPSPPFATPNFIPGGQSYGCPWALNGSATQASCVRIETNDAVGDPDQYFATSNLGGGGEDLIFERRVVRADISDSGFTMTNEGSAAANIKDQASWPQPFADVSSLGYAYKLVKNFKATNPSTGETVCHVLIFQRWRRDYQAPTVRYDDEMVIAVDYDGDTRREIKANFRDHWQASMDTADAMIAVDVHNGETWADVTNGDPNPPSHPGGDIGDLTEGSTFGESYPTLTEVSDPFVLDRTTPETFPTAAVASAATLEITCTNLLTPYTEQFTWPIVDYGGYDVVYGQKTTIEIPSLGLSIPIYADLFRRVVSTQSAAAYSEPARNGWNVNEVVAGVSGGYAPTQVSQEHRWGMVDFADLRAGVAMWTDLADNDGGAGTGTYYNLDVTSYVHAENSTSSTTTFNSRSSGPAITQFGPPDNIPLGAVNLRDSSVVTVSECVANRAGEILFSVQWDIANQEYTWNVLTGGDPVALTGLSGSLPRFTTLGVFSS